MHSPECLPLFAEVQWCEAAVALLMEHPAPCSLQQRPAHLHPAPLRCNMKRCRSLLVDGIHSTSLTHKHSVGTSPDCWSAGKRVKRRLPYLVSEQIPDHLCVACGCRQVERCHLVHVSVWEAKHSCLPQIVHCNTGKDNQGLTCVLGHKHKSKTNKSKLIMIPSPTCCLQSLHDALMFSPAGLSGANRLHTASFGAWWRCFPAWEESEVQTFTTNLHRFV